MKRASHKQALHQLLDRYGVTIARHDCGAGHANREHLLDEILRINDRFNHNPSLDEALNSGDGSYKP